MTVRLSGSLPDFPWDTLAAAKAKASAHPDGIVDLSVGTPVDPTPALARAALNAAADAPGYPLTWGTPALREAIIAYLRDRWEAAPLIDANVLPVIGTKELVAWLPTLLGLGSDDLVVLPRTAYPTYLVGARLTGARVLFADDPAELAGQRPALIWINSPANPHGAILSRDATRAWIDFARDRGGLLASDECYGEFGWDAQPCSVLDRDLNSGQTDGLLAVHSLSKRSNLAGYRAGFVAGDPNVVGELLAIRKHAGMMVPLPIQAAMAAALGDQGHVELQRGRYLRRRDVLGAALTGAGFRIEHSQGSLYLWCTRDEDGRASVDFLARLGILVAPGDFYGADASRHVRVALTATDERVRAAAERLAGC